MREITIALAQTAPVLNDNEENLRRMISVIQRICSEQPTDLIVFPELAVSGYECGLNFTRLAERVTGHAVSYLAGKAAEFSVHLVFRACPSRRRLRAFSTMPWSSSDPTVSCWETIVSST